MARVENKRKIFSFATTRERAEAIHAVAEKRTSSVRADVHPLISEDQAESVARKAFHEIETKGAGGYNRDVGSIAERYRGLGKPGTASFVELSVAQRGKFDFLAFHAEVDEMLGPEQAVPKIV